MWTMFGNIYNAAHLYNNVDYIKRTLCFWFHNYITLILVLYSLIKVSGNKTKSIAQNLRSYEKRSSTFTMYIANLAVTGEYNLPS